MRSRRVPRERLDTLRRIPAFGRCTNRELAKASHFTTELSLRAGKRLSKEGAPVRECLFIESGTVAVTCNGRDIALLGPGDWVGVDAVLDNGPATSTAVAMSDVHVSVMNLGEFGNLLALLPQLENALRRREILALPEVERTRPSAVMPALLHPRVAS